MYVRLVHLWGPRAKHVMILCMPSSTLPRRAVCFSDSITPGYHSWHTLWPK